ncbi:THUMP domain-containing protein [Aeropyrum pernix]|nr:THUMP domain-containing protein [Aeropyrum pernix]
MWFRGRRRSIYEANLIASFLPYREYKDVAVEDLRYALGEVYIIATRMNVIFARASYEDPLELRRRLERRLPEDTPVLRVIPVMRIVPAEVEDVKKAVHSLLATQKPGSFAIRLEARLLREGREIPRMEAVKIIAEGVNRSVDLGRPDILVLIKPFRLREGRLAAIYVGPPDGVFSSLKRGGERVGGER